MRLFLVAAVVSLCVLTTTSLPTTTTTTNNTVLDVFPTTTSSNDKKQARRVLVGVVTAPSHNKARDAIRATWATYLTDGALAGLVPKGWVERISIKFFIGNHTIEGLDSVLEKEPDVVRLTSFTESYQNLAQKTVGVVAWAKDNGFDALVKVDDDTFLRIDKLVELLEANDVDTLYSGHFQEHGVVIDTPTSKWYMRDQYDKDVFPPYAFGPCYLLGTNLVNYIADNRHTLFPYRVEDAAIAIWTLPLKNNIKRIPMACYLYNADCSETDPNSIFISPVNAQEMSVVQQNVLGASRSSSSSSGLLKQWCGKNGEFVLQECLLWRCRCWPPVEGNDCYGEFAQDEYQDVIPRLLL